MPCHSGHLYHRKHVKLFRLDDSSALLLARRKELDGRSWAIKKYGVADGKRPEAKPESLCTRTDSHLWVLGSTVAMTASPEYLGLDSRHVKLMMQWLETGPLQGKRIDMLHFRTLVSHRQRFKGRKEQRGELGQMIAMLMSRLLE